MRICSIIAAGLALVLSTPAATGQSGPADVLTERVERREVSETVPVFAEIVATRESDVAMRVAGSVTEVDVEVGSQVAAGDVLAALDRDLLELELRSADASVVEAQAGVAVARAGVDLAEKAFARVEGLRGTNAFSQGSFEDREAAVAQARGQMAQAEARLLVARAARDRAQYDLDRSVLRAPFAGTVMDVLIDPGEYVQVGTPVALLLDTDDVEVEANVPAQFVGALADGDRVVGQTDDGEMLDLRVRAILPTEFTATRTRPVRLSGAFSGVGRPVAVGQSVTVQVPTSAPVTATLVPKDAVTQAQGSWTVFVNDGGQATPRTVEIGRSFGSHFEVLSGLSPGDEVVVRGNERLRPMQAINPTRAGDGGAGRRDGAVDAAPDTSEADEEDVRKQAAKAN